MIRLIASDMDGTLLNDKKCLPADFGEVIGQLRERDIVFTVASGRTYSALDHLFPKEYGEKLCYICDNGACTIINGKTVNVSEIDRETFEELLDECSEIEGLTPIVCCESGVFHQRRDEKFFNDVGVFYKHHAVVDDLKSVDGKIFKLAVCDENGALTHGKAALDAKFGGRLNVLVSGTIWMDVMAAGVSKGAALKKLQETLGISRAETMAFGDYFNDLDMLMASDWSFCMENGHEDVKRLCRFTAPDNNHDGVTRSIKQYVLDSQCVISNSQCAMPNAQLP